MVRAVGYAYPWDYLDDPGAAPRAAELGIDVVALAASYHASRAVSPLHPTRRVRDVRESALYVPVREEAWRGRRLAPRSPAWSDDDDLFAHARDQLVAVGLQVHAWVVLTHHDDLGYSNRDLVVRNAFAETYDYALCPSSPEVVEYCLTLVEEVRASSSCSGVVLEACGPMGVEHASQHDKLEFARWSATAARLLSLCFCDTCRSGMSCAGLDVDELSRRVRHGVDDGADSMHEALGATLAAEVAAFRSGVTTNFRRAVVARLLEASPDLSITLHASASEWATGSSPSLGDVGSLAGVTAVVANCWHPSSAEQELGDMSDLIEGKCDLGAYLRMDGGWNEMSTIDQALERYRGIGLDEVHLYHLGLLSHTGVADLARVVGLAKNGTR